MLVRDFLEQYGVDESLTHFGTKGMHWGIRKNAQNSPDRTARRIAKTKKNITDRKNAIRLTQAHIKDAEKHGADAELFKQIHGVHADAVHKVISGKSRAELLKDHKASLQQSIDDYHKPALHALKGHLVRLERKQAKAA